jgi:hypothetical protein
MPAYSIPIPKPTCLACHRKATEEVFNRFNAHVGYYCSKHAKLRVAEIDRSDYVHNDGRVYPTEPR